MHAGARAASGSTPHAQPHSRGSIGVYEPTRQTSTYSNGAEYDFCNAFWGQGAQQRTHGATRDGDEDDWGRAAYETVLQRIKNGTKVLEDLKLFYKERANIEDEYAKRLNKLSKHSLGQAETGHLDRAILQAKAELDAMGKSHVDMAALLRLQENQVGDFLARREGTRKSHQNNIEKLWKNINMQRAYVLKAKNKYEDDALQINALHAQASLLQGRDLDKATMKLDKVQQTVLVNERDYKNYVNVLKETTGAWNIAWKAFLDLCQDQEEERIEFVKGRLWDWANALSTVAMAEDESAERTRTALEQCDPATDVKLFVQQFGTGNHIPDPLPFVDAKRGTGFKQQYKLAQFTRSSARMPGVSHSPSTVDDIARAFSSTSISAPDEQTRPRATSNSNSQNAPPEGYIPMSQRPPSRSANLSTNSLVDVSNLPASQDTTPTKPKSSGEPGSSRFAVSPSADLRSSAIRQSSSHLSSSTSRPGHVQASAFQRSPSASASPAPAAAADSSGNSSPRKPYTVDIAQLQRQSSPTKPAAGADDDDDDPLLRALNTLKNTPSPQPASPRGARSSNDLRSPQHQSRQSWSASSPSTNLMQLPAASVSRPSSRQGANRFSMPASSTGHDAQRPRSMSTHSLGHPDALRPHSPAPNPVRSSSPQPGTGSNGFAPRASVRPVSPGYYAQQAQPTLVAYAPSQSLQFQPQAQQPPPLQQQQFASPHPSAGAGQPAPANTFQSPYQQMQFQSGSPYARPPSVVASPTSYQPSPAPTQMSIPTNYGQQAYQQQMPAGGNVVRTASMHSGVSSAVSGAHSPFAAPTAGPASVVSMAAPNVAPMQQQQQQQQQMAYYGAAPVQQRPSSVVSAVMPPPQQQQQPQPGGMPPPTGQYTEEGRPILFYVSAMFDYSAASAEEFSFNQGDVIAVVETDPDGWWQGRKVGINAPIKLFPSNFTELLN
ncbi:hypothetical protein ACM66B_001758 [Microbotryomycetes sp. NB124-2]